ncbi:hypothetical protein EDB94_0329 [Marinobacter sp. 3-2]|jgi:hypothetical protein|uniref:hypothetical protein n=1 Tax=Marinobacter sp. 3-2 TaxID=2485141 RepID=UPI000D38D13A|nr:hypothetical protein [Marinobacter sp. 3-2]ROQ48462.1 hypothetical protein EDB94_0329 [Marinobacter sp. 3-2]
MEKQRETKWGHLAIPHGMRKDFDKLATKLTYEAVDRELSEVEDRIGAFLDGTFSNARFNRKAIQGLYEYGFNGSLTMIEQFHPSIRVERFLESFIGVSDINKHIEIYQDFDVGPSLGVIAIINAVAARVRLDRFRLNGDSEVLTIQEIALLARMKELSIRNAAAPSSTTPLESSKIDGLSIIKAEEADRWLAGRRGYKATKLPEEQAARQELFSVLDSWVFL